MPNRPDINLGVWCIIFVSVAPAPLKAVKADAQRGQAICWWSHRQTLQSWDFNRPMRVRARPTVLFPPSYADSSSIQIFIILCTEVIKGCFWTLVGKTKVVLFHLRLRRPDRPTRENHKSHINFGNSAVTRLNLTGLIGNFLVTHKQDL